MLFRTTSIPLLLATLLLATACRKHDDEPLSPMVDANGFSNNNGWITSTTSQQTVGMARTPTGLLRAYKASGTAGDHHIAHSSDDGVTWGSWAANTTLGSLYFASDVIGFTRYNSTMKRTDDGGHTWTTAPMDPGLIVGVPDNPGRIYGYGTDTTFLSSDQGLTWNRAGAGGPGDHTCFMGFVNGNTGHAGTWKGQLLRTTDGGLSWQTMIQVDTTNVFRAVAQRDEMNGVAMCTAMDGTVTYYSSTDGWATCTSVLGTQGFIGLARYDGSDVIYGTSALWIYRSDDHCASWTVDLQFPDTQTVSGLLRSGDRLIAWSAWSMAYKVVPL